MALEDHPFQKLRLSKEIDTHFIYFCPFCGDSKKHGHLYVSKTIPTAFCFKCGRGFSIRQIELLLNEKCNYQYQTSIEYNLPELNIAEILKKIKGMLEAYSPLITDYEKEYFRKRTKLKNITLNTIIKFSLYPDYYARGLLYNQIFSKMKSDNYRTWTLRGLGSGLSGRSLDSQHNIRYINGDIQTEWNKFLTTDTYFIRSKIIQNFDQLNPPKNLIIAEGIYDICSIYLNRKLFLINDEDSFFTAVQCSSYNRGLKMYELMYNCLPKNIIIFADNGIGIDMLKTQFKTAKNNINIIVNWPSVKDWDPIGAVKCSINL